MARHISIIALALLAVCTAVPVVSAEIFVICNSDTTLDAEDVTDVFLGGKQFSHGIRLVPVDNAAAQEEFLTRALHFTRAKYATYWTKKSFRDGTLPPAVKADDHETVQFVRQKPGGVGYVRQAPSGVKIITKH